MTAENDEASRNIYEQWHETVIRRDIEGLMALYAEDATLESPLVWAVQPHHGSGALRGKPAIGGFFAAESKFHRETDASKAAVVRLCESLGADGAGGERIIDVQWPTKHLMTLGVEPVERLRYLHMLRAAQELPSPTLR